MRPFPGHTTFRDTHKVTKTVPSSLNPDSFEREVLLNLKNDEIGKIAKADSATVSLGRNLYRGE